MLKYEGTDKIRDIKYEDGYVDKIYYDNNTQLVFTSDKEKTGVDEVLFKGRRLIDVTSYGKCIQTNLPLGYTQLEYIESSGTQYINTGITGSAGLSVDMVVQGTGDRGIIFSFDQDWSGAYVGDNGTYFMGPSTFTGISSLVKTNITTYWESENSKLKQTTTINGVTSTSSIYSRTPGMIELFRGRSWNDANSFWAGKIFSFLLKLNGVAIRNFIPAKNTSDIVGMYDTVTNTFFTNVGTGDFVAGPNVPTPGTPIDIVCNNGAIKARHQSGLPLGYTLLEYIESTGTQYIDLGYKGNGNTKIEVKFKYHTATSASGSGRVFGSRNAAAVDAFAIGSASGTASTNSTIAFFFGNQSYLVTDKSLVLDEWLDVIFDKTTHSINGTDYGDPYNDETFETPQNLKLFGFDNNGTMGYGQVDIARCKLWDNGVLIRDLVPCKNASNVVGMYDLVNDQFYTNDGTGNFVAGTAVSDPVEIYADGTVETINVHGNNIFNKDDTANIGNWYVGTSQTIMVANANETLVMRAKPNTTYYFKHCSVKGGGRAFYTEVENWTTGSDCSAMSGNIAANINTVYSITTSANAKWIFFNYGRNNLEASFDDQRNDFMVSTSELTSDTTYEQYFNGGSATAEMLLKVDDYQDEQEILSGAVTRNVGVYVFDGTESFTKGYAFYTTNTSFLPSKAGSITPICTHFKGIASSATRVSDSLTMTVNGPTSGVFTGCVYFYADRSLYATANDFKQFLADQYNSGNPVIVVYPLATATTETVTGQLLTIQEGNNIVEITQASIDDILLKVKYK